MKLVGGEEEEIDAASIASDSDSELWKGIFITVS